MVNLFVFFGGSWVFLLLPTLSVFELATFQMQDASVQLLSFKIGWLIAGVSVSTPFAFQHFSAELLEGSLWKARHVEDWKAKPGGASIVADGTGRCGFADRTIVKWSWDHGNWWGNRSPIIWTVIGTIVGTMMQSQLESSLDGNTIRNIILFWDQLQGVGGNHGITIGTIMES